MHRANDGLSPDGGWLTSKWTCPNEIPEGYGFQVVSLTAAEVTFTQSGDRRYVSGTQDKIAYSSDGRKVTVMGFSDTHNFNYTKIIAFPTIASQKAASGFGLKVMGSSIFLENTPPLGYAYATHKAKVYITDAFNIESTFPGLTIENAVFFFYTDDNKSFINNGFVIPQDHNGKNMVLIDYEVRPDGDIEIFVFHQQNADMPERFQNKRIKHFDEEGVPVYFENYEPCDVPESRWIDMRVEMPPNSLYNQKQVEAERLLAKIEAERLAQEEAKRAAEEVERTEQEGQNEA